MDGKLERLRDRLLVCAVCMDEYKDPRILPCFHSLCFNCIANVVQSSSSNGRNFRCPHCRSDVRIPAKGIQELPINFYILNLQEELSSREYDGTCEMCEGAGLPSEFRCVDCDEDICRFCIHAHRLEAHADRPKILRIQGESAVVAQPASSNSFCPLHGKERLQLFCSTCDIPICVACSCGDHKRHRLMPLSVKLSELRSSLKEEMFKIETDVNNLGEADEIMEEMKHELLIGSNKFLLALDKAASKACENIMQKKSALEKEILGREKQQMDTLDTTKMKVKTLLRSMRNGLHYLEDLQEGDMCLEAYQSFKSYSSKLEKSRRDFVSVQLTLQKNEFSSTEYARTLDFPFGFLRNVLYYGKLGSLRSRYVRLSINSKTLSTKRQAGRYWRPPKIPASIVNVFKKMLLFFLALFVVALAFRTLEKMEMPCRVATNIKDKFSSAIAFCYCYIDVSKQYFFEMNSALKLDPRPDDEEFALMKERYKHLYSQCLKHGFNYDDDESEYDYHYDDTDYRYNNA